MNKDHISLKRAKKLLQKKYRYEFNMTLVEGHKIIEELSKDILPLTVYISEDYRNRYKNFVNEWHSKVPIKYLKKSEFYTIQITEHSQGLIAIFPIKNIEKINIIRSKQVFFFYHIQDPTNLGNIIRSARWFNINELYFFQSVDPYNPKTIRAAVGQNFYMNYYSVENVDIFFKNLKAKNIMIFGITQKGNIPLKEFSFPDNSLYLFGSEGQGIKKELLNLCDNTIFIEGKGRVESLNLQTSFSIFAYEYFTRKID